MTLTTRPYRPIPATPRPVSTSPLAGPGPTGAELRLFDGLQQAVIVTDELGGVSYWNDAATRLYGWSAAEALGRPVTELTPSPAMQEAAVEIMTALLRGESFAGEFEVQRRDGSTFVAMVCDSPIYDEQGALRGVVGMSWDLTPLRERELELEAARAAAERANRQMNDFLAMFSHELRTPLTAILGYQELVSSGINGEVAAAHRVYLQRIHASAAHLRDLIDQILSLSRAAAGQEEMVPEPLAVAHFIRETAALVEPQAAAKSLVLHVRVGCAEDLVVVTDSGKLRQVLLNLLANAIKFTPAGGVELTADARAGGLRIEVRDTGVGFDMADAAQLFQPFRRLDNARDSVGSGLGLAIVERLAQLIGARVDVESAPGEGSRFTILLPLHPPAPSA